MKPADWNKMDIHEKIDIGQRLLKSFRGSYLIAQALHEAIIVMKKKPIKEREVSNIQDMEMILETCFMTFTALQDLQKEIASKKSKK